MARPGPDLHRDLTDEARLGQRVFPEDADRAALNASMRG